MATIKGQNLRVFLCEYVAGEEYAEEDLVAIGAAVSCTMHIQSVIGESSTKDTENDWQQNEVVGLNWDVQAEALITEIDENDEAMGADALVVGKTYVVRFARTLGATGEQNRDASDSLIQVTGNAILTDLQLVAGNRQNGTWRAQFTGNGELEQYTPPTS